MVQGWGRRGPPPATAGKRTAPGPHWTQPGRGRTVLASADRQRIRCESGAVPQLWSSARRGGEPGRLPVGVTNQPRGRARFARQGLLASSLAALDRQEEPDCRSKRSLRPGSLWPPPCSPRVATTAATSVDAAITATASPRADAPAAHRVAVAHRHRDALRHRRRRPGGRRRRLARTTPDGGPDHRPVGLRAQRRGDRRLRARPRRASDAAEDIERRPRGDRHRGARAPGRRRPSTTPTPRSRELGDATGHDDEAAEVVAQMQSRHRGARGRGARARRGRSTYYHELDSTLYSVTSETFIGELYALAGLENIADPADADGSRWLPAAVGRVPRRRRPRPRLPGRHASAAQQDRRDVRRPPGFADMTRGDATATSWCSTTTSRPAGARGSSTSCARSSRRRATRRRPTADRRRRRVTAAAVRGAVPALRTARLRVGWLAAGVAALLVAGLAGLVVGPVSHRPAGRRAASWSASTRACPTARSRSCEQIRLPRVVLGLLVGRDAVASAGPATRACSATRSPTRTCSARRPAPGSASRSSSSAPRTASATPVTAPRRRVRRGARSPWR